MVYKIKITRCHCCTDLLSSMVAFNKKIRKLYRFFRYRFPEIGFCFQFFSLLSRPAAVRGVVIGISVASVSLSVCPCSKKKNAWAINILICTIHPTNALGKTQWFWDQNVKGLVRSMDLHVDTTAQFCIFFLFLAASCKLS